MITAPFNFVPLNEKVFFPPWAEDVSHDIPFEDGESGEIEITITAKSPIFIRDHENSKEFCNYKGEYYIPGSSVKGMVRNVLEIMSFSKMSFLDDKTYSLRDLKYSKYMNEFTANKVQCGWLYQNGDTLKLQDCGIAYRVQYDEIDRYFNIDFKQRFMDKTFDNGASPYKKAYEKYQLLNDLSNKNIFDDVFNFEIAKTDRTGKKIISFSDKGKLKGKLVLTGHPSARKEPSTGRKSGKIYDFIFEEKENAPILNIAPEVFDNFKFAYFDGRQTQPTESPDWTFWKQKLYSGQKIPVFFHKDTTGKVSSFGLSYLYKFPYTHSIMTKLLKDHHSKEQDLAQTIFGYIDRDIKQALKGRVYFSHAKSVTNAIELKSRYVLLGSPKASYYPIYLVQNGKEYKTLMDSDSVLAGWKRYPIHKSFKHKDDGKSTQTSLITPLKQDTKFICKIKVHNLKSIEIGALLSAISFHGNTECYHNIGMAKPYGYGTIKVNITNLKGFKHLKDEYLKYFEACMNSELFDNEIKWHESEQVINLLTMATPQNDQNLEYMQLKDFAKEKNNTNYLDRYINLNGVDKQNLKNLSSNDDIVKYNEDIKSIKERNIQRKQAVEEELKKQQEIQKMQEEEDKFNSELDSLKNSEDESKLQSFIAKYTNSRFDVHEIQDYFDELKKTKKDNKFTKINEQAQKAFNEVKSKKGAGLEKAKKAFVKKWSASKNNKGSEFVLELVQEIDRLK
jgi:CRISPR-associated protein (TIGR03986 family)